VTGSYSVDANQPWRRNPNLTDSKVPVSSPSFFIRSQPTQAVFQERTQYYDATALSWPGDGRPGLTPWRGTSAFVWSGANSDGEEDFVGQLKLTSASGNNATGIMTSTSLMSCHQNRSFNIQFNGRSPLRRPVRSKHFGRDNHDLIAAAFKSRLRPCGLQIMCSLLDVDTARVLAVRRAPTLIVRN